MTYFGVRGGARWMSCAFLLVAVLAALSLSLAAERADAARPFTRAFTDDIWFYGNPQWIARTVNTGARTVLLEVDWLSFEPRPPSPGTDPTNPSGPQYSFAYLDAVLREFAGTGITPSFLVTAAPRWAEAPGGPAAYMAAGAWRPNPTAYGQAAAALARRYSGSYPDPLYPGRKLPRVRYFQAWGEANFSIKLSPQWVRSGRGWAPAGPEIYRGLLNAFYAGIKSAHADNVVLTTGLGPYGDPPGGCSNHNSGNGCRMRPAQFLRELLCLRGQRLSPARCPSPAHFDVYAIDPYEVDSPTTSAFNVDDVSAPDLGRLTRIVNRAVPLGRALPRARKQLWVTEFGYDSNPPNRSPGAISTATQARWLEQAFYVFWRQGVSTAVWYLIRDQAASDSAYYSGVYFNNGVPKPSYEAFRFPFVVMPSGRSATVWGIAPRSGNLVVQRKQARSWRTLFRLGASAGGVFVRTISARLRGSFRAVVGGESSLTWTR